MYKSFVSRLNNNSNSLLLDVELKLNLENSNSKLLKYCYLSISNLKCLIPTIPVPKIVREGYSWSGDNMTNTIIIKKN